MKRRAPFARSEKPAFIGPTLPAPASAEMRPVDQAALKNGGAKLRNAAPSDTSGRNTQSIRGRERIASARMVSSNEGSLQTNSDGENKPTTGANGQPESSASDFKAFDRSQQAEHVPKGTGVPGADDAEASFLAQHADLPAVRNPEAPQCWTHATWVASQKNIQATANTRAATELNWQRAIMRTDRTIHPSRNDTGQDAYTGHVRNPH